MIKYWLTSRKTTKPILAETIIGFWQFQIFVQQSSRIYINSLLPLIFFRLNFRLQHKKFSSKINNFCDKNFLIRNSKFLMLTPLIVAIYIDHTEFTESIHLLNFEYSHCCLLLYFGRNELFLSFSRKFFYKGGWNKMHWYCIIMKNFTHRGEAGLRESCASVRD